MMARAGFVIVLVALCGWVLWSFIPALIWASVIGIATWPLRERLVEAGLKPIAAAILLTGLWALLLVGPVIFFGATLAREAGALREFVEQARHGQLEAPDWLGQIPVVGQYLAGWWHDYLATPGNGADDPSRTAGALGFGRDVGRYVGRRLVIFGFTLLALLFVYQDGRRVAVDAERVAIRLFGAAAERYGRFSLMAVRATVNGLVLVGLGEGILLGIAYVICGVPHPIAFAVATAILGVVPFGAPVVLTIASLTLIVGDRLIIGLVMLGVGLVAVFIIDHTARPALIGGSIRLPFFWALLGVFGGLEALGFVGLFLGPAILAVALAIWREAAETANALPHGPA
jgi:predicted PurR-regulated permease PerM